MKACDFGDHIIDSAFKRLKRVSSSTLTPVDRSRERVISAMLNWVGEPA
jgi:hypothetical protein